MNALPLPPRESLTVGFKSESARLSDHERVEAVVCLANAEGGELSLGEEDGTPTGLHAEHLQLGTLLAVRTSPSVAVTEKRMGTAWNWMETDALPSGFVRQRHDRSTA